MSHFEQGRVEYIFEQSGGGGGGGGRQRKAKNRFLEDSVGGAELGNILDRTER